MSIIFHFFTPPRATGGFRESTECAFGPTKGSESPFATEGRDGEGLLKTIFAMLKVKAIEKLQKIGKYEGTHRYVMQPEMYAQLAQDKVIKEAAQRCEQGCYAGLLGCCRRGYQGLGY